MKLPATAGGIVVHESSCRRLGDGLFALGGWEMAKLDRSVGLDGGQDLKEIGVRFVRGRR